MTLTCPYSLTETQNEFCLQQARDATLQSQLLTPAKPPAAGIREKLLWRNVLFFPKRHQKKQQEYALEVTEE